MAQRVGEWAEHRGKQERRALETAHNDLKPSRPVSYCHPENGWNESITQDRLL